MIYRMTQQQFDTYLENTGHGISNESDFLAEVSNKEGIIVAYYWKKGQYIEHINA